MPFPEEDKALKAGQGEQTSDGIGDFDDCDDFKDFDLYNIFGLRNWNGIDMDDKGEEPEAEADDDIVDCTEPDSSMYGWPEPMARLRERIQKYGMESLAFDEQIEIILFFIMRNEDVSTIAEMAGRIANHFGTMARFVFSKKKAYDPLNLPPRVLKWLLNTTCMVRTYLRARRVSRKPVFRHCDLMAVLGPLRHTVKWPSTCVMYEDFEYRVIGMETVSNSTYWTDPGIVRHVVRQCVGLHARYIFLLLFSGTEPIELDDGEKEYLVSFAQALKSVKVLLLDCVILNEFGIHSLSFDDKFDILRREADWRQTHRPFLPNWNTPPGVVGPEVGESDHTPPRNR